MSYLTPNESLYPKDLLFKPLELRFISIPIRASFVHKKLFELIYPPIPQTKEDQEYDKKWGMKERAGHAFSSFDDKTTTDWKQVGSYWVRHTQGPHAHCWMLSRVSSYARWRNAYNSYCCRGFPYFSEESYQRFRREMEMVKPLLVCRELDLEINLERTLKGPYGTCWGITTESEYLTVKHKEISEKIALTKAAVERKLKEIIKS